MKDSSGVAGFGVSFLTSEKSALSADMNVQGVLACVKGVRAGWR